MTNIPFSVSARTAKLIGQENFSNAQGAVIELVKNSYDADAKNSIIFFDDWNESSLQYETLYIIDDGSWMTPSIIREKWMKIWTDDKLVNFQSKQNRVKSWAKWIGRFALDRLGEISEMISVPKESENGYYWRVDWNDFDTSESITNVTAVLEERYGMDIHAFLEGQIRNWETLQSLFRGVRFDSWTALKLTKLRDSWNLKAIDSLFRNLEILTPPTDRQDFRIILQTGNDFGQFWTVDTASYDDFDYKLACNFVSGSDPMISFAMTRNEIDMEVVESRYSDVFSFWKLGKYPFDQDTLKKRTFNFDISLSEMRGFGSVDRDVINSIWNFDFTFYYLKGKNTDKKDDADRSIYPVLSFIPATRSAWLNKFWWVKIFRDGFRVRPYWEGGEDWLKLWERASQSPQSAWQRIWEYRIRPYQISWTVNISRVANPLLLDKSGREWIQENEVFLVFKNLIIAMISVFENDRNVIMNGFYEFSKERNEIHKKKVEAKKIAQEVLAPPSHLGPGSSGNGRDNERERVSALAEWVKILWRELEEKDSEIRMLRNLASVWLIVSSFAHELKSLENRLLPRTAHLLKELRRYLNEEELKSAIHINEDNPFYLIGLMSDEDKKIKHWLDYSLTSLKKDKRTRRHINLSQYFDKFQILWSRALNQRNVGLSILGPDTNCIHVDAFEMDLDSIFNNLLSNSLNSLENCPPHFNKGITINWHLEGPHVIIDFTDNGPWLWNEFLSDPDSIFNAFVTSKRDKWWNIIGTWLWLYIVKATVSEYQWSSVTVCQIKNWFGISVSLPAQVKEDE